ncbi:MAG: ATP-binding protein [Anaerolineae bacterium]
MPFLPNTRPIQIVERLRWGLPILILLFVIGELLIEQRFIDPLGPNVRFTTSVLVYGLIGPMVTWWVLTWIAANLRRQEAAEEQIRLLNRELEERVTQRTGQLRDALQQLQDRNEELELANQELTELDRLKSEFVSMVSHELRAPLTNINGAVELLMLDGVLDPHQRTMLQIIGEQTQRLTRLVQGILNVSRIEAGRLQLRQENVDVSALIHRVAQEIGSISTRSVEVNLPEKPLVAWADADRVEEVLTNLIDNALKYSEPSSTVGVQGYVVEDEVVVAVSDRGVGIPTQQINRIFEKFHRVEQGDDRETYGHGLGLYIARGLVEALGGRIWVESTEGEGSTFYFTLPEADGPHAAALQAEAEAAQTSVAAFPEAYSRLTNGSQRSVP